MWSSPARRPLPGSRTATRLAIALSLVATGLFAFQVMGGRWTALLAAMPLRHSWGIGAAAQMDVSWHAPALTQINNLTGVLAGNGVYGFIYNSSVTPDGEYGSH